ncbi:MAG: type II toxin-antitoxin system RelE/ParE family toxin [Thermomonas sp.]|uniref:type II toxin-antitoxin system RelE/ParE family toxin n=1 Tax=Thermomonas sp. TaxID=1971895 RepID=UPI0039E28C2F
MLPVIWLSEAIDDLSGIAAFIAEWNPSAAEALVDRIVEITQPLAQFPYMGRQGRVPGTRELLPHSNYCVVYEVKAASIEITAVLHVRREYP